MKKFSSVKRLGLGLVVVIVATALVAGIACGDDDEEEPAATATTMMEEPTDMVEPTAMEEEEEEPGEAIELEAASASITVDGDTSDWEGIEAVSVPLEQIEIPATSDWDEPNPLPPVDATLKVAADAENIYVLVEIPDDYDFVPDDHNLSAALAVQFLIDEAAGPHMGAAAEDLESGLGMVDIWHWELDCGPGEMSGGGGVVGGDDANCNLDDEYATDPETREDDGGGDAVNAAAENSLAGVWEHTARAEGVGADGTWIFEMSRPLQNGDSQDAQFASGGTALVAIAYFDADETLEGWSDTGHLQSAENGWIEVTLP